MANDKIIWDYFKAKGLNDYGIAGLMGNLYAESGLMPNNLQNTGNKKFGMSDDEYVVAVDSGTYTNFVRDSQGFGIAQWTFWKRKENLLDFARATGKSIGDLHMQLDFLWKELNESFAGVLGVLKSATSVLQASNAVLFDFERPANQDASVQKKRASFGQTYYDKYAGSKEVDVGMSNSPLATYTKISPNKTSPRRSEIDSVIIHCIVGQWTAKQGCDYFSKSSAQCSANYVVGKDGSIGLSVEEKDRAWCSGGKDKNGNVIRVNGISGADFDHRAIAIEVASDATHPYAVTAAAYEALIKLLVDICQRNPNIKTLRWAGDKSFVGQTAVQNMGAHRWFANKACPGDYLYNRMDEIATEVNGRLGTTNGTINTEMEDEDMDVARFEELWHEMRKGLQDNDASAYSAEARNWALSNGLIAGNGTVINGEPNCMWGDVLTREQFVTVLYRFAQIMGKA